VGCDGQQLLCAMRLAVVCCCCNCCRCGCRRRLPGTAGAAAAGVAAAGPAPSTRAYCCQGLHAAVWGGEGSSGGRRVTRRARGLPLMPQQVVRGQLVGAP
jgi:hypothetical protein